jgi:hypothetical protein
MGVEGLSILSGLNLIDAEIKWLDAEDVVGASGIVLA